MKTSKVTKVEFTREHEKNGKLLYGFEVGFENGDKGFYSSIDRNNPKFKVGETQDYEVQLNYKNGKPWNKIVFVSEYSKQKKGYTTTYDKGSSKSGNASFALSYAKDYYIACCNHVDPKTDADTICEVADIFKSWLDKN